jgi:hypothetical protein
MNLSRGIHAGPLARAFAKIGPNALDEARFLVRFNKGRPSQSGTMICDGDDVMERQAEENLPRVLSASGVWQGLEVSSDVIWLVGVSAMLKGEEPIAMSSQAASEGMMAGKQMEDLFGRGVSRPTSSFNA